MGNLLVIGAVAISALAIGLVAQRRAPKPTTAQHSIPTRLDRADFVSPSTPWLVAIFTSATCEVCASMWAKVQALESGAVAVQEIEYRRDRTLHDRYAIDAVPLTLITDSTGAVRRSFAGPTSAAHLWAAVAELR